LGLCLSVQILTGLFLAIHYCGDASLAFSRVRHICRDVNYGWLLRILHANGARFFFMCLFLHVGRGLYFGSYLFTRTWIVGVIILLMTIATAFLGYVLPWGLYFGSYLFTRTWIVGVIILLMTIATAFLGYVLPWGQISFWGATVITNLFSAIPYIGENLVQWIWGGFAVDNPTLMRFFSLHFLLPFTILGMRGVHLLFLHQTGSNNPLGLNRNFDKVSFHPYFSFKDLFGFFIILFIFSVICFFLPLNIRRPWKFFTC